LTENIAHPSLDRKLFEQLFRQYFGELCNFARSYINDDDTAKEITQNVFINLWQNKKNIDSGKSVKSYLFTSVRNRCLNHIRDNKKFRSSVLDVEIADYETAYESDAISVAELETKISSALDKLPERCRQVFMLNRFEDLKYKEVAEKLGISIKTVEVQMSKALKILREELKDYIYVLIFLYLI
jgi:RNA polymerase sigma-70 factor (ECF subfamily)